MAAQLNSLMKNKDQWMTPDLVEKIHSNPVLKQAFSDPRCAAALQEFSTNPAEASKKYAHIPGINEVFRQV